MAGQTQAAGAQAAPPEGAQTSAPTAADVKARIKAITGHEAAAGRTTLAAHLAFDTDMDVDSAVAVMQAAAEDAPPAAPDAPEGGEGGADDAPTAQTYQTRRTAAQQLAQPGGQAPSKPQASIDMSGIYAARKQG